MHPDDITAFDNLARRIITVGRAFSGCSYMNVAQDLIDGSKVHLVEGWSDQRSIDTFFQDQRFQVLLREVMLLRILDRRGKVLTICDVKSLEMPT